MQQRLISAAVLVPVVVIVFLLGNPWLSLGIVALAAIGAFEAARLVRAAGLMADTAFAVAGAGLIALLTYVFLDSAWPGPFDYLGPQIMLSIISAAIVVAGFLALRHQDPRDGFRSFAGNIFAALYPALLTCLLGVLFVAPQVPDDAVLAGFLDAGRIWMLVLVLTVWSFDSFAYLAGRTFGWGHFMNHISPNKTWSGVIGGTVAAMLVCTVLVWAAGQPPLAGLALGLAIAVAAQAGDLAESVVKRAAGAKDSSNLIPGHGGILDRVDSFLFAAPVMFVALTWGQLLTWH